MGFLGFVGFNPKIPPSQPYFYGVKCTLFFPRIRLTAIPNPKGEPINETINPRLTSWVAWGILFIRKDALESADSPGNSGVRWMRRSHRLPFLS